MLLTALATTAFAAPLGFGPPPPCGTLERLPLSPRLRTHQTDPLPPALPGPNKGVRNPFGTPNVDVSDNFAVHYGNSGGVTQAEVDRLLLAFELAWQVQIGSLGSTPPYGTDQYRFNVYLGDTGNGAPGGYGTGGYYFADYAGWPTIVVSADTLNMGSFADHTASHEFYHAVQGATDRFDYTGLGAWFWEATAEWAAIETDPSNNTNGSFVFGYLLLPELPVNFFDYPDTGALQEYHQYGAFVFPHFLTEATGNIDLIGDAWASGGNEPDPMEVLRADLADQGEDLDQLWLDHLARNVVYDYDQGALWENIVDGYLPFFPDAVPVLAEHKQEGMDEPERIRGRDAPYRYGYSVIRLKNPSDGDLLVTVDGDAEGNEGSAAQFGARVVRVQDDLPTYLEVPFDGTQGELLVAAVGDDDEVWLVVGAWTDEATWWEDERFPYDYALTVVPPPDTTTTPGTDPTGDPADPSESGTFEEIPIACGCASGPTSMGVWALPLLGLGLTRRR